MEEKDVDHPMIANMAGPSNIARLAPPGSTSLPCSHRYQEPMHHNSPQTREHIAMPSVPILAVGQAPSGRLLPDAVKTTGYSEHDQTANYSYHPSSTTPRPEGAFDGHCVRKPHHWQPGSESDAIAIQRAGWSVSGDISEDSERVRMMMRHAQQTLA